LGRGDQRSKWDVRGGIVSLAKFVVEHREALDADLLKTGYEAEDIGCALSWGALGAFIKHLPPDSAVVREAHPEESAWATTVKTNSILADIYDMLSAINTNLAAIGSGKPAKRIKPYPRPGHKDEDTQHIGTAVPVAELNKLFRKEE